MKENETGNSKGETLCAVFMKEPPMDYWLRQALGAARRAKTFRNKAKTSRDPQWCINMAKGAEKDYSRCFRRWRRDNPSAPYPEDFQSAVNSIN